MVPALRQLSPRQRDAFRGYLAAALEGQFAYPLYFDYRRNQFAQRPLDNAKRMEIVRYLQQLPLDADIPLDSPAMERWIAQTLLGFANLNPALATQRATHRRHDLIRRARQAAVSIHQHALNALPQDPPAPYPAARPRAWLGSPDSRSLPDALAQQDRHTQMLALVLARPLPQAAREIGQPAPVPAAPATRSQPHASSHSAFETLAGGAQTGFFGFGRRKAQARSAAEPPSPAAGPREAPADLLQLYGEYLSDLQPEMTTHETAAIPRLSTIHGAAPGAMSGSADARTDLQVFYQLRFQIEGYVRKAAQGYGLPNLPGDPAYVIEALRGSNLVDESDLRMAEGILALTDRVIADGAARLQDYRQALMLYLLYHRSHLA